VTESGRLPQGDFLLPIGGSVSTYNDFIESKRFRQTAYGKSVGKEEVHPLLFPFQKDVTVWAVKKGRVAIFLDTGLGKTLCQLEWARLLNEKTLIIAPLSVARQTTREGEKIGLDVQYVRSSDEVTDELLWITNYEMIDRFDFSRFGAVVLDESSILKSIGGHTRRRLTELCSDVPYRLCCTATPAPNDHIELGNHAEFLGICSRSEMLAQFFINANKEHTYYIGDVAYRKKGSNKAGTEWRLKHHAEKPFFRWLASWAIVMTKPSDLGYDDDGFILPPLNIHTHFVDTDYQTEGQLFFTHIKGIREQTKIRRHTLDDRLLELINLVNGNDDQWIVWAGLNEESKAAANVIDGSVEVCGDDSPGDKAQAFEDFQDGKSRVLITKAKIAGFGMNFQNAHKMVFFGLNHSWESYYQCIRREWRYLQTNAVDVHIILSDIEDGIFKNVMRKDAQARRLREQMVKQLEDFEREELGMVAPLEQEYRENTVTGKMWTAMLGDSSKRLSEIDDCSIDLSVYSPPFADLYTYTSSPRDLGNSRDWDEFFEHYAYIIREVLRVTKPGRVTCVHTSDIPALAQKDGYIGIKDFPGRVITAYEKEGWTFHGRVVISKNPQAQAIRTHSKGLLFVQLKKDSVHSRPALLDQILIFRKPGDNEVPITPVANGEMDNETWINWACGIWHNINETNVLQHGYKHGRAHDDEKHICPLQLETIERCIKLYSNPGETILSPFGGIGSEGYVAVKFGRRAILIELKESYFNEMIKNLQSATSESTKTLFEFAGIDVL
jgi:DNA modification methylase